mgnify:CR=1 FL=1
MEGPWACTPSISLLNDTAACVGSQNLYICDLDEWGVVIDNKQQVKKMMDEYWKPMWQVSYRGIDVDVQKVMDGLNIDRSAPARRSLSVEEQKKVDKQIFPYGVHPPVDSEFYVSDADGQEVCP